MSRRINKDDIDKFFDYELHIPTRTIWCGSVSADDGAETGTDFQMAERLIKGLWILDKSAPSGEQPITILMNNLGGNEYHCFAMYDAIKACKNHVTIIGIGHVMSAGSIMFQAADERIMTPHARMMIHYGTWFVPEDHPKNVYKTADEGKKIDKIMKDMYLERIREKHPMYTEDELDKLLNFDTYLDPHEAVALGLADKVGE